MSQPMLILLPGMDGTGTLFAPLRRALAAERPGVDLHTVSFPIDTPLDHAGLAAEIEPTLPGGPLVLVAESFSGALALQLAHRLGTRVSAIVLVATFVVPPVPAAGVLARLAGTWTFGLPLPRSAVRALLVGTDAPDSLVNAVIDAVDSVSPTVLATRLDAVLRVDATPLLRDCQARLLCIHATRDRLLGERSLAHMTRLRPDMPVVEVDAPHLVLQTAPGDCARAIQAFATEG